MGVQSSSKIMTADKGTWHMVLNFKLEDMTFIPWLTMKHFHRRGVFHKSTLNIEQKDRLKNGETRTGVDGWIMREFLIRQNK